MWRKRQRRFKASDSSRVLLEVRTTNGVDEATTVPSSGIETWKSERISRSSASVSISTRSTSSIRSTTGLGRPIASSSGRAKKELLGEDVLLELIPFLVRIGLDAKQLLLVVPLVKGLGFVEALVALEPDQPPIGDRGQGLGQLGLADAGRPFDQHRLGQPGGQEHDLGDPIVGEIVLPGEGLLDQDRAGQSRTRQIRCCYDGLPSTDLALTPDHPTFGGQRLETHRPANMELLGRDADLGPEPELLAIGESGRGIDRHHRRFGLRRRTGRLR